MNGRVSHRYRSGLYVQDFSSHFSLCEKLSVEPRRRYHIGIDSAGPLLGLSVGKDTLSDLDRCIPTVVGRSSILLNRASQNLCKKAPTQHGSDYSCQSEQPQKNLLFSLRSGTVVGCREHMIRDLGYPIRKMPSPTTAARADRVRMFSDI